MQSDSNMNSSTRQNFHGEGKFDSDMNKNTMVAVIQFLKKSNLKATEDLLRKEVGYFEPVEVSDSINALGDGDLAAYKSDGNPAEYLDTYKALLAFVDKSLDAYKHEVSAVMYPVLVHMYLELVYNGHVTEAVTLMQECAHFQESYHMADMYTVSLVKKRSQMSHQSLLTTLLSSQYTVRMAKDSLQHLKRFLADRCSGPIARIVQDRLTLEVYEGPPRSKQLLGSTQGGVVGEAPRNANSARIYYGLLKEPDYNSFQDDDDYGGGGGEEYEYQPRRKKSRRDAMQRAKKNDPNAPPLNRIPLPELRDGDKVERMRLYRDSGRRVTVSRDALPSICFYTLLNAQSIGTACASICDDASLMAVGCCNGAVFVHSLTANKLKTLRHADHLTDIDKDSEDVLVRMLDERTGEHTRTLLGHYGAVTSCDISPDRALLLTSSTDGTMRLWSLHTWTCVIVLRGHIQPVWSCQFSPHGYYFISGSQDRTVRLWATDQPSPLRVMGGHFSDVDVVQYHPNSNYVASGSSDRSVRVWDLSNGSCVRNLSGHKDTVTCLAFSPCGRYLVSGAADATLLVWDLGGQGQVLTSLQGHTDTVHSLAFSREGNVLTSGGLDCKVRLWDFAKLSDDCPEDTGEEATPCNPSLLLHAYPTKHTNVMAMLFTRRNVLLSAGTFAG